MPRWTPRPPRTNCAFRAAGDAPLVRPRSGGAAAASGSTGGPAAFGPPLRIRAQSSCRRPTERRPACDATTGLALPRARHVGERQALELDPELARRGVRAHLRVAPRRRSSPAAKFVWPRMLIGLSGWRPRGASPRRPPTGRADTSRPNGFAAATARRGRRAPQRVEHEVVAVAAGRRRGSAAAQVVGSRRAATVASAPSSRARSSPAASARGGDDPARRPSSFAAWTRDLARPRRSRPARARSRPAAARRASRAPARPPARRRRRRPPARRRARRARRSRCPAEQPCAPRRRRRARRCVEVHARARPRAAPTPSLPGDVRAARARRAAKVPGRRSAGRPGSGPRPTMLDAPSPPRGSSELPDLGDGAVLAQDRGAHRADTTIPRSMDDAGSPSTSAASCPASSRTGARARC